MRVRVHRNLGVFFPRWAVVWPDGVTANVASITLTGCLFVVDRQAWESRQSRIAPGLHAWVEGEPVIGEVSAEGWRIVRYAITSGEFVADGAAILRADVAVFDAAGVRAT